MQPGAEVVVTSETSAPGLVGSRHARRRSIGPMDSPDAPVDPRAALLRDRAGLLAGLEDMAIRAPEPMTYGSQAAAASQVFEQLRDLALDDRSRAALEAVDSALARLDGGRYGTCTSCGKRIGAERLEALPSAALCIDCQRHAAVRRR